MILPLLVVIPIVSALLCGISGKRLSALCRWIALLANAANLAIVGWLWAAAGGTLGPTAAATPAGGSLVAAGAPVFAYTFQRPWIPSLGISFTLGADGLSLLLLALTGFLGIMAVLASWKSIEDRVGFFHFNLMLVLAGVNGVFMALDLFLFAFAWELMLVPMYFLIDLWGHENRHRAALVFFLYTQIGGLLMLVAIVGLALFHARSGGAITFDYRELLGTSLGPVAEALLMLGFFFAFAVKLPAFPFHTWLPDAHTEAPTAGSVILAGLLLKTGGFGLIRFAVPLFPEASRQFAPIALGLAVAGILYGGLMAFSQSDFKRLVAYTSVSHLGFVLLGVYALNPIALAGAGVQMLSHGLSTGALFIMAGSLQDRTHTRDMRRMGALWGNVPRMGAAVLVLTMALLGLPGLGNFVGEFLVLVGVYQVNVVWAAVAGAGMVVATIYALRMFQLVFHGKPAEPWQIADLDAREAGMMIVIVAGLLVLGLYPQPVLKTLGQILSSPIAMVAGLLPGGLPGGSPGGPLGGWP